jgi:hypothetical protein
MQDFNLAERSVRELNAALHAADEHEPGEPWEVRNPRGAHAVAVGINAPATVNIHGHVGYYCAGMNQQATVVISGNAGVGVAENMMSGYVHVKGDASQSAGATAHGGLLVVDGNATARCGISLKGADIVVKGNVGHMSAFMAQAGRMVVLGDAGDALGDSLKCCQPGCGLHQEEDEGQASQTAARTTLRCGTRGAGGRERVHAVWLGAQALSLRHRQRRGLLKQHVKRLHHPIGFGRSLPRA